MKLLKWTDDKGFNRQAWVRNDDSVPDYGIPHDPPNLSSLNIDEETRCKLHNELVNRNLITYLDVLNSGNGVTSVLRHLGLIKYRQQILTLYKIDNRR